MTPPSADWSEFISTVEAFNARVTHLWAGTDDERTLFIAFYQQLHNPTEQDPHSPYFEQGSIQDWSSQVGLTVDQVKDAAEILTDDGLLDVRVGFGDTFAQMSTTQAGWYRYFELTLPDFSAVRERIARSLLGHRDGMDATVLARELGLGYLLVATVLRQLDAEGLLRIAKPESSAGVHVVSISPRLLRTLK